MTSFTYSAPSQWADPVAITLWILFVVLLIVAFAYGSAFWAAIIVLAGLVMLVVQCAASRPDVRYGTGRRQETEAPAPSLVYPRGTDPLAVICAERGDWSNDGNERTPRGDDWETGYEAERWCNTEQTLRKIAENAARDERMEVLETTPRCLPATCSTDPLPCEQTVDWQPSFVGCSTTFVDTVPPGGRPLYRRDPRARAKRLDNLMYERSIQSGAVWDPYKHFESRQKFAQFLSADLVNRKDHWMRPVET